jgi:hypothetical protein
MTNKQFVVILSDSEESQFQLPVFYFVPAGVSSHPLVIISSANLLRAIFLPTTFKWQ